MKLPIYRLILIGCVWTVYLWIWLVHHYLLKNLGKEAKSRHWPVILHAILIEGRFFKRWETWADLKCEGKEPSVSDKLTRDVIGVINMSMQSFTRLVGIGSKSEDLHGARTIRWRTSSAVTQLKFCGTLLVSGEFNTPEGESEGNEEQMTEILLMKTSWMRLAQRQ